MFTPPQNRLRAGLPDPLADRPHEAGAGCGSSRHGRLGKGAGPQGRKPTQRTLNHDTHPKSMGLEPNITVARFFEGVPALLRLDEPFATSTKR